MTTQTAVYLGNMVIFNDMTIREIAEKTGISKTWVHFNLMKLRDIDNDLFIAVRIRLENHNKMKHIKGSEATRRNMLEIKANKGDVDINSDNESYNEMAADMAIMILAITDYMNGALRDSGSDIVIPYDKFVLDIAKLVSEYIKLEAKTGNEERPS